MEALEVSGDYGLRIDVASGNSERREEIGLLIAITIESSGNGVEHSGTRFEQVAREHYVLRINTNSFAGKLYYDKLTIRRGEINASKVLEVQIVAAQTPLLVQSEVLHDTILRVPSKSCICVEVSEIVTHNSSTQANECAVVRSQVHEFP